MTDRFLLNPFFLDQPLRELEALAGPGWRVNSPTLPAGTAMSCMAATHRPLAAAVAETLGRGERPIAVAGDCCAAIAVGAGLERAGVDPVLVWLDAHGDFNTPETSPSGFVGGMPLAMLVGRGDRTLTEAVSLRAFPEERVALTDARDLDPGERQQLEASAVRHLADPRRLLTPEVPPGPLWVHFDVDVVDPGDVPAVPYPAPGGLRAAKLDEIFRRLAAAREIAAVSFSTWSPELDLDGGSREVCLGLLRTLLGGH